MRVAASVLALASCATPPATVASAWGTGTTLPHPELPAVRCCSDPQDPYTFIILGNGMLVRGRADSAAAAFYWASRFDPTLAQPYYGRSVALLLTYGQQVRQDFGDDVWVPVARIPRWRMAVVDSLRLEALARDPFLSAQYDHLLTGRPPFFALAHVRDPAVRGYWMYDFGQTALADSLLGVALTAQPSRARLRQLRARAEYDLGRYDSAAVQLRILLDTLSHRDSSTLALAYASKEMIYYALGYAQAQRGDTAGARLAFENAVTENAAFYPAHSRLAAVAVKRSDVAAAIRELDLALEIAPNDPALLFFHAAVLLDGGDAGRAAVELVKAIDIDPYFAKPYLLLGKAHEARGDMERAAEAYGEYASHERLKEPQRVWAEAYADTLRRRLVKPR